MRTYTCSKCGKDFESAEPYAEDVYIYMCEECRKLGISDFQAIIKSCNKYMRGEGR